MERIIGKILEKIHRKFAKDTEYPQTSSEDMLVRLDFVDDAISEWEDCVMEGYNWPELIVPPTDFVFSGTGEDDLPINFLSFMRRFSQDEDGFKKAELAIGGAIYAEVNAPEGEQAVQEGLSPYIFWTVGGKIKTLPAVSGTIKMPYLKKAYRYVTGEETTEIEMANSKFIEDYVLAKLYFDNADDDNGQAYFVSADDRLKKMKYALLS